MKFHIIENTEVAPGYGKLVLEAPKDDLAVKPGQFFTLRCGEATVPLIRRPISLHRIVRLEGALHLEMLYRVVGKGTKWLLRRAPGEFIDALGPFGNGFRLDGIERAVLVAGGIGLAPLYAVGDAVRNGSPGAKVTVIMGARSREELFYVKPCQELGETFVSTDDGSCEFNGTCVDLLTELIRKGNISKEAAILGCGPPVMLRRLAEVAKEHGLFVQVSLEECMCCGFGACLSCAIPLRSGRIRRDEKWPKKYLQWSEDGATVYSLVCKDGPVFDINEVDWDEWFA